MSNEASITVTAFGDGQFQFPLDAGGCTVGAALAALNIDVAGRRVALNGHPADSNVGVIEGDELTVVPRVEGG